MTITLPLPTHSVSPNARCHWRNKAKVTRSHRTRAKLMALAAFAGFPHTFSGYALAFYWPNATRRDDDNAEASTKAYRDGIADALAVDDYTLRKVSLTTFAIDRDNPRLEITLIP